MTLLEKLRAATKSRDGIRVVTTEEFERLKVKAKAESKRGGRKGGAR